ncbi:hypothetical protein [Dyella choica]|uniref:Uncharacterized protein n=1 Tax=Dyella choica TaxID=1927959 RepID=A0A3S0PPU8_9GAMM|nr:hypothetical protein [Dyella choica]RUL78966.1 hypothetical protein EKH80_03975 [Dyella choica]
MSASLYDFDTSFAPFEAFAPLAPYAPMALMAWFAAPMQWWGDICLNTWCELSETLLNTMVYPGVSLFGRGPIAV